MTIEVRMTNAILDVEGHLSDGLSLAEAIVEAAQDNLVSPNVLRLRAEKALGALDEVADRTAYHIRLARERAAAKSLIVEYGSSDLDAPAFEWLAERLGRNPTFEEHQEALRRATDHWVRTNAENLKD